MVNNDFMDGKGVCLPTNTHICLCTNQQTGNFHEQVRAKWLANAQIMSNFVEKFIFYIITGMFTTVLGVIYYL